MAVVALECKFVTEECIREWKSTNSARKLHIEVSPARFIYELCWTVVRMASWIRPIFNVLFGGGSGSCFVCQISPPMSFYCVFRRVAFGGFCSSSAHFASVGHSTLWNTAV